MRVKISLLILSVILSTAAFSQGNDSLKAQLIQDWERAKAYTKAYLEAMPADKYSFRAVDSIRSFSELMLHLAQGNINLSSNGFGKERLFGTRLLEKSPTAQGKDSVMYFVMASYDYCIDGMKNMDPSRMDEVVKSSRANLSATRRGWIMKAFEHQTHERGQCTIYIRLQGIRPPAEMLF